MERVLWPVGSKAPGADTTTTAQVNANSNRSKTPSFDNVAPELTQLRQHAHTLKKKLEGASLNSMRSA